MENDFGSIKSFVKRFGRVSPRQRRGLEALRNWRLDLERDADFLNKGAPVVVEIGFGMGADFLTRIRQYPHIHFIGIEVYPPGVGTVCADLEENPVDNCRILHEDALDVMRHLPDAVLDGLLLYFPDPWPKKKHHKRRLALQDSFIGQLIRVLKPGGFFHYRTDWVPYHEAIVEKMHANGGVLGEQNLLPERDVTKYERRGERLAHEINEGVFRFQS